MMRMSREIPSARPRAARGRRGAYRSEKKVFPQRGWQALQRTAWSLAGVITLVSVVVAVGYGYKKLDAQVAEVSVTGDFQYVTREMVEQWVSENLSGGFFSLDMVHLCERLESQPWIAEVNARRQWPDRLVLHISEDTPVARWGETQFVDQHGKVLPALEPVDQSIAATGNLPKLVGPEGKYVEVMEAYRLFAQKLETIGIGLRELTLDELGGWSLQLDEGGTLVLGRDHLNVRFERFLSLWEKELRNRRERVVSVDARYENGLAVKWLPEPEGTNEGKSAHQQSVNLDKLIGRAG